MAKRRRRMLLSKAELAREADVAFGTLNRLEGGVGTPLNTTVAKIVRALGLTAAEAVAEGLLRFKA